MKELICIVCPNGCKMAIEDGKDGELIITGNKCARGRTFAITEMTHPMRTICSTVKTCFKEVPVLPVRVSEEIPKERIFDVMKEINQVVVTTSVGLGDVIIANVLNLQSDIIATSNVLKDFNIKGDHAYE